jgi:hypothetical protein
MLFWPWIIAHLLGKMVNVVDPPSNVWPPTATTVSVPDVSFLITNILFALTSELDALNVKLGSVIVEQLPCAMR